MRIDIKVFGAAALEEALEGLAAGLLPKAAQGMGPALEAMAREARSLAPVDSGTLKASIRAEPVVLEGEEASARVVAGADHAAAIELGSRGRPAQPFLHPAYQAHKEALLGAVAAAVREGLS